MDMFAILGNPCFNFPLFLIDPQTGLNRRLQKPDHRHCNIQLLHMMMLSRDILPDLVSALYRSLHILTCD